MQFDRLIVHFKQIPSFFNVNLQRKLAEVDLYQNYTTMSAILPRQIKKEDANVIDNARIFNFILAIILFGGIAISYVTSTSLDKFLYMINELQLIFHLPLMHLIVPGNVLIAFTNMIDLVKYDILTHFKLFDFSSSIKDAQNNPHAFFNGFWFQLGYKSYNIRANIGTLLIVIIIWLVLKVIRLFVFNYLAEKCKNKKKLIKSLHSIKLYEGKLLFI